MSERKKIIIGSNLLLGCITLMIGLVCLFPVAAAASAEENVYRKGESANGVSLMINVYWGTEQVEEILDILADYKAKATFFIGGCWADDHTDTLKKIAEGGHELASHGYFHKDCTTLSYDQTAEEINLSRRLILLSTGAEISLFAPPSGAYNDTTTKVCEELNLKMILWSRDTVDWRDKDENLTFTRATEGVTGGDFILMHPMETTVSALPRILKYYKENGLQAVTVTENLTYGG